MSGEGGESRQLDAVQTLLELEAPRNLEARHFQLLATQMITRLRLQSQTAAVD